MMLEITALFLLYFIMFVFVTLTYMMTQKRIERAEKRISDLERYNGIEGE